MTFPRSYVLAEREIELAEAMLTYGRYDEASFFLEHASSCWRDFAGNVEVHASGAMIAVVAARLCRALGDMAGAVAATESVLLPEIAVHGRFSSSSLQLVSERARAETAGGNGEAGHTRADIEWRTLRQHLGPAALPHAEAHLLRARAEANQALGDHIGARRDWELAVQLRRCHDHPCSIWLAADLIDLAANLAKSRRHAEARLLADEATRIFAIHPTPGRHLLAPLRHLQRGLEQAPN